MLFVHPNVGAHITPVRAICVGYIVRLCVRWFFILSEYPNLGRRWGKSSKRKWIILLRTKRSQAVVQLFLHCLVGCACNSVHACYVRGCMSATAEVNLLPMLRMCNKRFTIYINWIFAAHTFLLYIISSHKSVFISIWLCDEFLQHISKRCCLTQMWMGAQCSCDTVKWISRLRVCSVRCGRIDFTCGFRKQAKKEDRKGLTQTFPCFKSAITTKAAATRD